MSRPQVKSRSEPFTPVNLNIFSSVERKLIEEALQIFGGTVVAIKSPSMNQNLLPLSEGQPSTKKQCRGRKGHR